MVCVCVGGGGGGGGGVRGGRWNNFGREGGGERLRERVYVHLACSSPSPFCSPTSAMLSTDTSENTSFSPPSLQPIPSLAPSERAETRPLSPTPESATRWAALLGETTEPRPNEVALWWNRTLSLSTTGSEQGPLPRGETFRSVICNVAFTKVAMVDREEGGGGREGSASTVGG